jgi:hypothetical protein
VIQTERHKTQVLRPQIGRPRLAGAAVAILALAVLALAVLASGCGGSAGPRVAQAPNGSSNSSGSSSGSGTGDPAAYSACMRKHGVPNFPDPDSKGRLKIEGGRAANGQQVGLDVGSPQFKKAQRACKRLQPRGLTPTPQQQAKAQQQMLRFARCMRSHGVPKFPDPKFSPNGGSQLTIGKNTGVDPSSPQFQAAQKACRKLVPGSALSGGPGGVQ